MNSRADLDRSLVHGIAWTSAVTWFSQLLTWGSTFYVVSVLTPSDYGLVGMAAVYFGLVRMTSELGLGAAVVQFRTLTTDQIAQFNALSVLAGLASVVLSLGGAMLLSWYFEEPRLTLIVIVMSSVFFINAFRVVPQAVLQRELQFRKLALIEGVQAIAGAGATLAMAARGFGYWTLVFGPIVSAIVFALLIVIQHPFPFRRPQMESIRQPFEFSKHTLLTRFAWFAYSNADSLVIGRLLGKAPLGAYQFGGSIAGMAVEKITSLIGRATPAVFSAVQHNLAELRRYLLLTTEGLSALTFPACIGIALVADDLVPIFGPEWEGAIRPMQLLAILATVRSIDPLIQQVLSALGEARINLWNTLLTVAILPFGLYAGVHWGLVGVATAWLVIGPVLFSRLLFIALERIEMPRRMYFAALWPATSGCLVMAGTVIAVDQLLLQSAALPVALAVKVAVGAIAYAVTLLLMHRDRILALRDVVRMLRTRRVPDAVTADVTTVPTMETR